MEVSLDPLWAHPVTIIPNLDTHDAIGFVALERDLDVVGVSVEAVPDQFDHRPDRVRLERQSLNEVFSSGEGDPRHAPTVPADLMAEATTPQWGSEKERGWEAGTPRGGALIG